MKRCLKMMLSLALILVLTGAMSIVVCAHHRGHHTKRAKSRYAVSFTANRDEISGTAENAEAETSTGAVDTTVTYASCYENGFCSQNNVCDVNGVCQNGGICSGAPCAEAPCWQGGTCLQDGSCDVNGICQNGGNCYWIVNQNTNSGNNNGYGHHGGHHGGRHHR